MTASTWAIMETDLDRLASQIKMAEQHQSDLAQRVQRLHRPCKGHEIQGVLGKFNIKIKPNSFVMAKENKYGFTEVVDTLSDSIRLLDRFEDTLQDGVQFMDAMVILAEFPTLQELYNDRTVFIREFRDLTAEEAAQVYVQVAANTGTELGIVQKKALAALDLSVEVYDAVMDTIARFQRIKGKALAIAA